MFDFPIAIRTFTSTRYPESTNLGAVAVGNLEGEDGGPKRRKKTVLRTVRLGKANYLFFSNRS